MRLSLRAFWHYVWRLGLIVCATAFFSLPATASEGGYVAGPLGGSDLRAALAPPPGTYLLFMPLAGNVVDLRDRDGNKSPLGFSGSTVGAGAGLYHVFEDTVAGGRIGLGITGAAARICVRVAALNRSECQTDFADTYIEAFWSRPIGELGVPGPAADDPRRQYIPYGLTLGISLGAVLPTGAYSPENLAAIGLNTRVLVPSVAATWISPPWLADGTEFSARIFYNIHDRNDSTGYQAGDMVVVDWALTERIGRFQLGPAGTYANQVRDDRQNGQNLGRTEVVSVGGVIATGLPEFGMFIAFKALTDVEAQYRVRVDRAILRIGMRF
jgi:hypothetical protein